MHEHQHYNIIQTMMNQSHLALFKQLIILYHIHIHITYLPILLWSIILVDRIMLWTNSALTKAIVTLLLLLWTIQ